MSSMSLFDDIDPTFGQKTRVAAVAAQITKPCFIWGPPGHGKTSMANMIARFLAKKYGSCHQETVLAATYDPPDLIGWPLAKDHFVSRVAPEFIYNLSKDKLGAKRGLLFLDEFNTAPEACEAACLRLVQERRSGNIELGENVAIFAAGNNGNGGATNRPLGNAMASRVMHIRDFTIHPRMWAQALLSGFPDYDLPTVPEDWRDEIKLVTPLIAAYMQTKPGIFSELPTPSEDGYVYGYTNPRTMFNASEVWAACRAARLSTEETTIALGGIIGTGEAISLLQFADKQDLQDPEELLKNPKSYKIPDNLDSVYITTMGVATAYSQKQSKDRYRAALDILLATINSGRHPKDTVFPAFNTVVWATKQTDLQKYGSHDLIVNHFGKYTAMFAVAVRERDNK